MVMSIDRYLAVVHPIKSTKWRKPRVAKLINLTVWGVSLLVILPTMIFSGLNKVPVCGIVWPEPQDVYYKAFIFYTFFIGFFLPLAVICLCYLLIIVKVRARLYQGCQLFNFVWSGVGEVLRVGLLWHYPPQGSGSSLLLKFRKFSKRLHSFKVFIEEKPSQ